MIRYFCTKRDLSTHQNVSDPVPVLAKYSHSLVIIIYRHRGDYVRLCVFITVVEGGDDTVFTRLVISSLSLSFCLACHLPACIACKKKVSNNKMNLIVS